MAIDTAEKRKNAAGVAFLPLGPGVTPNALKGAGWRAQAAWYYKSDGVLPPPIVVETCFITIPPQGSIASYYFCLLRDVNGLLVAVFDDWIGLGWKETINEVYEGAFIINGNDSRTLFFQEDCRLEIFRSVPGVGLDWYKEAVLVVDGYNFEKGDDGKKIFSCDLVGLNDFVRRREVGYRAGTIRADKSGPSDTVIQEYVSENAGTQATIANGRLEDGVTPNLSVSGALGIAREWQGGASGQNLLSVVQSIADYADIDFNVIQIGDDSWRFVVYPNKMGKDRTNTGLDANTGLNAAGNAPVYFSIPFGTVSNQIYRKSRRTEYNTIFVWGKGEKSTQKVIARKNAQTSATKYNKRELSVSASVDYTYQMNQVGDDELANNVFEELFDMTPLQQVSQLYGKHYFLGDRLMVIDERTQQTYTKRIIEKAIQIDGESRQEQITFSFE